MNFEETESIVKGVSRQQKWHRLTPLASGGLAVFPCMQENTVRYLQYYDFVNLLK